MDTLKTLRDAVLYQLDEAGDTSNTKTNVDTLLNIAHATRLTEQKWPFMLWPSEQVFSLTNARQIYPLHEAFGHPYYLYNSTKQCMLTEVPMREVDAIGVDFHNDSAASHYSFWGRTQVKNQPTAASTLTLVSSSASDTGATYAIKIKGMTADGLMTETLSPTGTTPAVSMNSYIEILSITKVLQWNGTLTLTADSGATTILVLTNIEYGRNYQQVFFHWIPGDNDTIKYRFYRIPGDLVNDFDLPDIPAPHSKILIWDTLLLMAAYDDQLNGGRLQVWQDNQQRMDLAMRQAFLDGQSIRSSPKMVRYIDT
jgi:hypothetical protein